MTGDQHDDGKPDLQLISNTGSQAQAPAPESNIELISQPRARAWAACATQLTGATWVSEAPRHRAVVIQFPCGKR